MFFFVLLLIIQLTGCEKENALPENQVNFSYEETYCANPWEPVDLAVDDELKARVSEYLNEKLEVNFSNLRITHDGKEEICSSCSCTTGRIVRIEAEKAFQDILIRNSFKVE